jgi:hypothetical protein
MKENQNMSGDKNESREAQAKPEKAPAFLTKGLSKSEPTPPPESGDVQYLTKQEWNIEEEISTLKSRIVRDPDINAEKHSGPWVEVCVGRDPETKHLRVVRMPGREIEILPSQVMRYRGSVIQDRQSTHKADVLIGRQRHGYVFDRFFYHNKAKLARCALVEDRVHQAGLMYERVVDKLTRKVFSRIRRIKGTQDPMYEVVGASETDYRDLRRLYDRYFLRRNDQGANDPALDQLISDGLPLADGFMAG